MGVALVVDVVEFELGTLGGEGARGEGERVRVRG